MQAHPEWKPNGYKDGIARVKNSTGDYAFIFETVGVEYEVLNDCSLRKFPTNIYNSDYGIGLRKGNIESNNLKLILTSCFTKL